jgi:hypothetical protein
MNSNSNPTVVSYATNVSSKFVQSASPTPIPSLAPINIEGKKIYNMIIADTRSFAFITDDQIKDLNEYLIQANVNFDKFINYIKENNTKQEEQKSIYVNNNSDSVDIGAEPLPTLTPLETLTPSYSIGNNDDYNFQGGTYSGSSNYLGQLSSNPFAADKINSYALKQYMNPYAVGGPKLYDSQGNYHGVLNGNKYDPDSISNPYGQYGSEYSSDSINNPYGAGSKYNSDSPNNEYGNGWSIIGN